MDNEEKVLEDVMLTTVDNPYNPKTDYDKWQTWDHENGYWTDQYLARLIDVEVDIEDDEALEIATNNAILEILDNDVLGIYKLV